MTSVHQTTAGKMIFGRMEDRAERATAPLRQAAAAGRGDGNGGVRPDAASRIETTASVPEQVPTDVPSRVIFPELDEN